MKNKFYLTTPIYYPNAKPHIGSVYSTVMADIIARYERFFGKEVVFLTGVDEHGQKVFEAAQKAGKKPQVFVDEIATCFKELFRRWNISYTIFMRTTDVQHTKAVKDWILLLQKKDLIYKGTYSGWYSTASEAFLSEKDIEVKDAEGIPLCPITQKKAIWLEQDAYFFRLSFFEQRLLDFFDEEKHFIIPYQRREEVISFIKSGLRDLCISRSKKDLSWGISFPGDDQHVIYVWADALNNYITGVGFPENEEFFNRVWPCDLHVLAKDILRFHTVYWIAFLMAAELPLPKRELVHGWLLVDNKKMSKSLGNIVDPWAVLEKYHEDSLRYYFATLSCKDDVSFSETEVDEKHNSDLSDTIGNLVERVRVLALKRGLRKIIFLPSLKEGPHCQDIIFQAERLLSSVKELMLDYSIQKLTIEVLRYAKELNSFFHESAPWKKEHEEACVETLAVICKGLEVVGGLLYPIMPTKMRELYQVLGLPSNDEWLHDSLGLCKETVYVVEENKEKKYLFEKYREEKNTNIEDVCMTEKQKEVIRKEEVSSLEQNTASKEVSPYSEISFEEFSRVVILVGKIIEVEDIPKSKKLYYLTVDFGEYGIRKIASGIKEYYQKEDLIAKKTIFSFNIPPRKLCGVVSQGMILMSSNSDGVPEIIPISQSVLPGTRIQ
jgi:methionyl-tRNA synthetase